MADDTPRSEAPTPVVVTRLREMSPLYELAKEGVDLSQMQWEVH